MRLIVPLLSHGPANGGQTRLIPHQQLRGGFHLLCGGISQLLDIRSLCAQTNVLVPITAISYLLTCVP